MDASAIAGLSPEERAVLKAALNEAEEPSDEDKLADLVKYLCEEMDALKEEHARLKGLVMDDLIGGIKEAYEGNVRASEMEGFKGKYGAMLEPLAEPFKRTFGADLMDKAFDYHSGLKGEEGYSDEVGEEKMKEVIQQIKEKLGLNEPPAAVVTEVTAAAPAPAEEGEADEEPDAETQAAWDEIEAMKRRDDARDERFEKRQARKRGA